MKVTGKIHEAIYNTFVAGGKTVLVIHIDDKGKNDKIEKLKDKKLSIEIKGHSERRSLNANSYFHILVRKLAEVMGTSEPYMKNHMLQRYGQYAIKNDSIAVMILRDDEDDYMEWERPHVKPTQSTRVLDDGVLYRVFYKIRNSATYNTYEMSKLIDGTVQDCKDAGIEVLSPAELDRMKEKWGIDV